MKISSQGIRLTWTTAFGPIAVLNERARPASQGQLLMRYADEASNSDNYFDADSLHGVLKDNSALFNVVLGGEFGELIDLALNNGGNSFDLNELNTTVQSEIDDFVTNFAEVKLQETVDFCAENPDHPACTDSEPVPAPAGIALLSLYYRMQQQQ